MARAIRSTEEAAGPIPQPVVPQGAVAYANNLPNRNFTYGEGKTFRFSGTRVLIEDPELLAFLDNLAKTDRTVFRIDAPAPPELTTEPPTDNPIL